MVYQPTIQSFKAYKEKNNGKTLNHHANISNKDKEILRESGF